MGRLNEFTERACCLIKAGISARFDPASQQAVEQENLDKSGGRKVIEAGSKWGVLGNVGPLVVLAKTGRLVLGCIDTDFCK